MKNLINALRAVALFSTLFYFVGCSMEESREKDSPIINNGGVSISAKYADTNTKANFTDFGIFSWSEEDGLGVLSNGEFKEFALSEGAGSKTAQFTNEEDIEVGDIAVYPYSSETTLDGNNVTITLPNSYTYPTTPVAIPMIGKKDDSGIFQFSHVMSLLKLNYDALPLGAETLKVIATGKKIAGEFTYDYTAATPEIASEDSSKDAENCVTVSGFPENSAVDVFIPIPTGTYDEFIVEFLDESGEVISSTKNTYSNLSFDRADLVNNAFSLKVEAYPTYISVEWPKIDDAELIYVSWSNKETSSSSGRVCDDPHDTKYIITSIQEGATYVIRVRFNSSGVSVTNSVEVTIPTEDELYKSSDYSMDGQVDTLQLASEGYGVDVVFMGDGFTDKMIEDGSYDKVMNDAIEAFFTIEPVKSFRNLFNLYKVYAVSESSYITRGCASNTVFGAYVNDSGSLEAKDTTVATYSKKASSAGNVLCVVVLNTILKAGKCHTERNYEVLSTEPMFRSIAYCPLGVSNEDLAFFIHHEADGHGLGKLGDEYVNSGYEDNEYTKSSSLSNWHSQHRYLNIDTESDPTSINWAQFISDSRYSSEVGVYEGASVSYGKGIYRPSEYSIMGPDQDDTSSETKAASKVFNAPSRFYIYNWIQHIAFDTSLDGDYDAFVEYDQINR